MYGRRRHSAAKHPVAMLCLLLSALVLNTGCELNTSTNRRIARRVIRDVLDERDGRDERQPQRRPRQRRRLVVPAESTPYWQYSPRGTDPNCPDGYCPVKAGQMSLRMASALQSVGYAAVPAGVAQRNWSDRTGYGSCAWASLITILRWQGRDDMAVQMGSRFNGGATWQKLVSASESLGMRYIYTDSGDPRLLEWASDSNRGGVIFYKPQHAVAFLGFSGNDAIIIDPNTPRVRERIPKQTFLRNWRSRYQGFFLTPVYPPGTPHPVI